MEKSTRIDAEKSWKKHQPASALPADPNYFLKSSAPNNVDVWQFQNDKGEVKVRSKPVSDFQDLKHCPTDYEEWQYLGSGSLPLFEDFEAAQDVNIDCVTDATSK